MVQFSVLPRKYHTLEQIGQLPVRRILAVRMTSSGEAFVEKGLGTFFAPIRPPPRLQRVAVSLHQRT